MDYLDANRFAKTFVRKGEMSRRSDSNSKILKAVLEFEIIKCNQNFRINDFNNYLYFDKTFKDSYRKLNQAIEESDFIYLHSYGKNGKSTFIEMFRNTEIVRRNYSTHFYDFRSKQGLDYSADLLVDVENFYWDFIDEHRSKRVQNNPLMLFFKYLCDNFDSEVYNLIRDQFVKRSIRQYYRLSRVVISKIEDLTRTYNGKEIIDENVFFKQFCKIVVEEFEFADEDAEKLLGYVLMNILVATKVFYAIKHTDNRKVLFFFDNLDDVHTYLPEDMNISYTANIINFIENLSVCYSDIFCDPDNNVSINPSFIFVYRTSNYLSTLSAIYEQDDSQRSRVNFFDEDSVRRVRITSVKDSFSIIRKRLDFYKELCEAFSIKVSSRYELIVNILNSFAELDANYDSKFDPSTILRLWNGNKLSFSKFITNVELSKLDTKILLSEQVPKRIKAEVFFHYFIKSYYKKANESSPYAKFINYSFSAFNNDIEDQRCSLSRLFFTYVFNKRFSDRKIESVRDAFNKGVSLDNFMNDIQKIKNDGVVAYSVEDIKSMFENLFAFEIDNWGNFFSCCAPTRSERSSSKEHYKWIDNTIKSITNPIERKRVRFFDNDSAPYFMFKLKRSFEYFSFSSNDKTSTLVSSISFVTLNDGSINAPYRIILNRVYSRIEKVCDVTYSFFLIHFEGISILEYCSSNWAYNNRMLFDDLISKIIDYLENVRMAIINREIPIGGGFVQGSEDDKIEIISMINRDFARSIEKYINLFFKIYNLCLIRDANKDLPKKLNDTAKSFEYLGIIAKNIINEPKDFTSEIATRYGR